VRRDGGGRLGGERGHGVHRGRRIRPGMLADAVDPGEKLHRPGGVSCRGKKGDGGGARGGLIGVGA
jgi:hypothetical protein